MKEMDMEYYVSNYVGIVCLNIFVECAGIYRVEAELLHGDGYIDIRETMYLSCDRRMAAMVALEVLVERATILGYEVLVLGKSNERYLTEWVDDRNHADFAEGFDQYIEDVTEILFANNRRLDSYRIENLYLPEDDSKPLKVLLKSPEKYAHYLNKDGEEEK